MINKFIELIRENRRNQKEILRYSKEQNWANIYHDSIRGKEWLEELPLNIGRWAGNYTFFYLLNRILFDFKPLLILELGLGESTKFINAYLNNYLYDSSQTVIEENSDWKNHFIKNHSLNVKCNIEICEVKEIVINKKPTNVYDNIEKHLKVKYDFYLIDGPIGSSHFSRFDMVKIGLTLSKNDEFIIMIDDYERNGEKDSVTELYKIFEEKGITVYPTVYYGLKQVIIIATRKYIFTKSL